MKAIESIYIAGKMQDDDWRRTFFDETGLTSSHPHKNNPLLVDKAFDDSDEMWPKSSGITVCGLRYTGPFFIDNLGGHGYCFSEGDDHGGNVSPTEHDRQHGAALEDMRSEVQQLCLKAIANSDLIFAWIDCIDCYGTIAEIGYAKALGKVIWIAGPRQYNDLWFVYHMADDHVGFETWGNYGRTPRGIFESMLDDYRKLHPQFDSPIEQAFWDAYMGANLSSVFDLVPQHQIGKYRVDFAHLSTRTVIELDGHATHSSPDAIAYDRKREREIEEAGWYVVRFGGKEIYSHADKCAWEVYDLLHKRNIGHSSE